MLYVVGGSRVINNNTLHCIARIRCTPRSEYWFLFIFKRLWMGCSIMYSVSRLIRKLIKKKKINKTCIYPWSHARCVDTFGNLSDNAVCVHMSRPRRCAQTRDGEGARPADDDRLLRVSPQRDPAAGCHIVSANKFRSHDCVSKSARVLCFIARWIIVIDQ